MNDIDFLSKVRDLGETYDKLSKVDDNLIGFIMRVGQARNILNASIMEFKQVKLVMAEIAHQIPQFHKQPAIFKTVNNRIDQLIEILKDVNYELSYIKKQKDLEDDQDDNDEYNNDDVYNDDDD
jgi:hypothetical protein